MEFKNHKLILQYLMPEKNSLKAMLVFSIVSSVFLLSIPFIIQQLVEQYALLIFQEPTVFLIALAVVLLVGISIMRVLQMHLSERIQRRIFLRGTQQIKNSINDYKNQGTSLGLDKINYFFESISLQKSLVPLIIEGLTLSIQTTLIFTLISFYHPLFFIYSLLILGSMYFALIVLGRKTEQLSIEESVKKYAVLDKLQSLSINSKAAETDFESMNDKLLDYFTVREDRYQAYLKQSITVLVIKISASVLLLGLGGILVVKNKMTIGQFVASELIITNLLISLFKFTYLLDYWYDTVVAVNKLNKYFPSSTDYSLEMNNES